MRLRLKLCTVIFTQHEVLAGSIARQIGSTSNDLYMDLIYENLKVIILLVIIKNVNKCKLTRLYKHNNASLSYISYIVHFSDN